MGKRITAVLCALLILAGMFSGCSGNDEWNIAYPVAENVRTLDPQYASSATAKTIIANCFEGLVGVSESGEIIPAAAESWTKDGLVYTFRLRKNAVWKISSTAQEGMSGKIPDNYAPAVTADDFVFAFRRLADPATSAPDAYLFSAVQGFSEALAGTKPPQDIGVRAVSADTLTITLVWDDPDFLFRLLQPAAMPCHEEFFNACAGRYGLATKYMLTNGAFYFSRWNTDTSFRITKNDLYTGERKAKPATVWFYLNDDSAAMNRKLAEGVYTAGITTLSAFSPDSLDRSLTAQALNNGMISLIFNCKSTVPAVKSLRTALLSGIDRSLFQTEGQTLTESLLPENLLTGLPEGTKSGILPDYNESDAKASLKAALLELDQSQAEITILCTPEYEALLKKQMQAWQKLLGVSLTVRISAVPESDLLTAVANGNYEAAFYPLHAASDSAVDFLRSFTSGAKDNITGFSSAEYDALFLAVSTAASRQEQAEALTKAIQFLSDNSVYYPVYSAGKWFVSDRDVSGIYRYGGEVLVYFSQAEKQ